MWPVKSLISLIGWNYSIQTGENISTNESTQIYHRSHTRLIIESYTWKPPNFALKMDGLFCMLSCTFQIQFKKLDLFNICFYKNQYI